MRASSIHLFVPGIALAIVGFVMVGPGGARPVDAARLLGGPVSRVDTLAFRVELLRRMHGIERPLAQVKLMVDAESADGSHASAEATTSAEGVAEVTMRWGAYRGTPKQVTIVGAGGEILAAGAPRERAWQASERFGGLLGSSSKMGLTLRVAASRGVFAAPFPDDVIVEMTSDERAAPGASVELSLVGATFGTAASPEAPDRAVVVTDAKGRGRATLTPSAHTVELDATAKLGAEQVHWHGVLPVVPGAIWLDPISTVGSLRIVSPIERPFAYVSVVGEHGRHRGFVAPLITDERGFAAATVEMPWDRLGAPPASPVWVVLASDAHDAGSGTVGWPLAMSDDPFSVDSRLFQTGLLLDGVPAAEAAERGRRRRARWLAVGVLALAGLAEALLLLAAARQGAPGASQAAEWESYGLTPPRPAPVGLLVVAIGTLVATLVAIGIAVVWKLGG